jgi:hypothetical protein
VLSTVPMGACRPCPISPEGTVMESMPAPESAVTVGVDTHLDSHVAAAIDQAGRLLDTNRWPPSVRVPGELRGQTGHIPIPLRGGTSGNWKEHPKPHSGLGQWKPRHQGFRLMVTSKGVNHILSQVTDLAEIDYRRLFLRDVCVPAATQRFLGNCTSGVISSAP